MMQLYILPKISKKN